MAKKTKFYVVWEGREKGIFDSWDKCKAQIEGFPEAKYKSFETLKEAEAAFKTNFYKVIAQSKAPQTKTASAVGKPIKEAVVVDAACSGSSGDMEYQGFYYLTGERLFHQGVFFDATNNIGEFLAIVHALAFLKKNNSTLPIYSDSKTAMAWVRNKTAKTKLEATPRNKEIFELIARAEKWLKENTYPNKILKWETEFWGENPADFGRK